MPVTSYPFILEFLTPQTFGPIGQQLPSKHSCPACQTSDDELLKNPRNGRVRRSESSPQGWRINRQLCLHRCVQPLFTKTGATCLSNDLSYDLPMTFQGLTFETALNTWECVFSGDRFLTPLLHPTGLSTPPPPKKRTKKIVVILLLQVTRHDISEYKEEPSDSFWNVYLNNSIVETSKLTRNKGLKIFEMETVL